MIAPAAPSERETPEGLDRRAVIAAAILLALALAVNLDRWVDAPRAVLRAHDVADNTVTGLQSCGDFWRSGLQSTWDAARLRGWPRTSSSQNPQMLMCIAGGLVPPAYIMPIFHTLVLAAIAVGGYLFVAFFLRRSHETAIAGSLLNLLLYFYFHEHPIVPSAILLPPLIGILSLPVRTTAERLGLFAGAALILGLSNPPPTLVLMPLGHVALIVAAPRSERRAHLVRAVAFWGIYGIYYLPTMITMLREYADSSRSLYKPSAAGGTFVATLQERLLNPAILTPGAALLALVGRRTWRGTLGLVAGVLAFVAVTAGNEVLVREAGARFPILISLSTTYYRMYYFLPIAVLIWAVWLFDDVRDASAAVRIRQACGVVAATALAHAALAGYPRVFMPFHLYVGVIGAMAVTIPWWTRRTWSITLVAAAVLLFGRYEFSRIYEVPNQGNLFVEAPHFGQPVTPGRTVTVMTDCDAVDVFPAQARIAGEEILDGIANYYSRRFVERWRYYVADNPATCTSRYGTWSTRAELTEADLSYSADRILSWLWINNVRFVRSAAPLAYPSLTLADHRAFRIDGLRRVQRYLYRLDTPVGDVFTMPAPLAARTSAADLRQEEQTLYRLRADRSTAPVAVERLSGSHLRFTGDFGADVAVIANVNYHRGWHVSVDGESPARNVTEGPFGMIRVPTASGTHRYDLIFTSPVTPYVPALMACALALLWLATGVTARAGKAFPSVAIAPRRAWTCAAIAMVALAAVVWVRGRPAAVPWLPGEWAGRLALDSPGLPLTGALSRFPVHVEVGPEAADLWASMDASRGTPGIVVTDAGGQAPVPIEVERFDPKNRQLSLWVQLPRLLPGAQRVGYLYFGHAVPPDARPRRVWDDDFSEVWPTPPTEATAVFPAGSDRWTVEFDLFPLPSNGRNYELLEAGPPGAFNIYLHEAGYIVVERHNGAEAGDVSFPERLIEPSRWTHVAISRTAEHLRMAIDGQPVAARQVRGFRDPALAGTIRFGAGRYGPLDGQLAHVRISAGEARSADWELATAASLRPGFIQVAGFERR